MQVIKARYHEYVAENVYIPGVPSENTVLMSANLQKSETLAGLVVDSTSDGAVVYVDDIYTGTNHYGELQISITACTPSGWRWQVTNRTP